MAVDTDLSALCLVPSTKLFAVAPVKTTTKIRMKKPKPRLTMRPYGVSGSLTGAALTSDMSCV
jgi:hypothetical protein